MRMTPFENITIEQRRWRTDVDQNNVATLADSIARLGLIHAPLARIDEGGNIILIAGETRTHAMMKLHGQGTEFTYAGKAIKKDHIPLILISEISNAQAKETELEENIIRFDLSWQEKANATAELHEMYKARSEEAGLKHNITKTGEAIAKAQGSHTPPTGSTLLDIRNDLILSAYTNDPEIGKIKDRGEAMKALRKKLEREHRENLSKTFQTSELKSSHKLLKGSLLEIMPELPAAKYDLIIADPPYGVDASTWQNQSAVKHSYDDSEDYSDQIIKCIAEHGYRITKLRAHAYIFCDINRFAAIKAIFESMDWYVWKWPLIWYRGDNSGILPRPEHGPRRTYEAIVYCIKNDRPVQKTGASDTIIYFPHERSKIEYGAQKPYLLYKELISRSCLAGNEVIDPCCGSGPIFPAAEEANVIATGIELNDEGYAYSYARIRDIVELDQKPSIAELMEDTRETNNKGKSES